MNEIDFAKELIKKNEGLRLKPYLCPAGKITIGYGRNLTDNGISMAEALELFENDFANARVIISSIFGLDIFKESEKRVAALLDMAFNLGETKLRKFVKFIAAVKAKDWKTAAGEIRNSLWYRQVPNRAEYDAKLMEEDTDD